MRVKLSDRSLRHPRALNLGLTETSIRSFGTMIRSPIHSLPLAIPPACSGRESRPLSQAALSGEKKMTSKNGAESRDDKDGGLIDSSCWTSTTVAIDDAVTVTAASTLTSTVAAAALRLQGGSRGQRRLRCAPTSRTGHHGEGERGRREAVRRCEQDEGIQ